MDIEAELIRLFGLKSAKELSIEKEVFGQGGYLSFRRAVTIVKAGSSGPPLHVFVKWSDVTRSELDNRQLVSNRFCRTECVFYGLLGPVLESVMQQYDIEPVFPRVFSQRISEKGTILVMEDMTKHGFGLVNRHFLSVEEAYSATRALARLQAAFWIARTSFNYSLDSVLFGPNTMFSNSIRNSGVDLRELIECNAAYFAANVVKRAGSAEISDPLLSSLDAFVASIVHDPARALLSVRDRPLGIMHGDLWFSNFMFKSDSSLLCRLFDWQFWNIGLFGLDLGLLMVSGLSNEALQEHVDKIPAEFYRTFKEIYEAKTGNPAPFTEEAARENMGHAFFWAYQWVVTSSSILWEANHTDVRNLLANAAFAVRTNRVAWLT